MKFPLMRIPTRTLHPIMVVAAGLVLAAGCVDFEPLMKVDPNVPLETIKAAGASDDPALIPPLLQYLELRAARGEDGLDNQHAEQVIISLAHRDAPKAVPNLILILRRDQHEFVKHQATVALGRLGGPEAEAALFECIVNESQQAFVRKWAEIALVKALSRGSDPFTPPDSPDPEFRLKKWKQWWKQHRVAPGGMWRDRAVK